MSLGGPAMYKKPNGFFKIMDFLWKCQMLEIIQDIMLEERRLLAADDHWSSSAIISCGRFNYATRGEITLWLWNLYMRNRFEHGAKGNLDTVACKFSRILSHAKLQRGFFRFTPQIVYEEELFSL